MPSTLPNRQDRGFYKKWQVRRESNPQPPDLESGALPIGATDLHGKLFYLRLFVNEMFITEFAVLLKLNFVRRVPLILGRCIIPSLAFSTGKSDKYSIHNKPLDIYSIISPITPAPTVRPPSRIANLSSFSIAIGAINSTLMVALSPGIIISTPSSRVNTPVISVVRKKN